MTISSSPAATPSKASDAQGRTSSQASGAPSEPCRGAFLRFLSTDRMTPTGRSTGRALLGVVRLDWVLILAFIATPRARGTTVRAEPGAAPAPLRRRELQELVAPFAAARRELEHEPHTASVELVLVHPRLEPRRLDGLQAPGERPGGHRHGLVEAHHLGHVLRDAGCVLLSVGVPRPGAREHDDAGHGSL